MASKPENAPRQEQLESAFDRSASAVRDYAHRFEKSYGRRALDTGAAFYVEHPALFVVVAVFLALSLFPILTFVGFSLFVITSVLLFALGCAAGVIIAVELFLLSILLAVLFLVAILTFFVLVSAALTYSAFRLGRLAYSQGVRGVGLWTRELAGWVGLVPAPQNTSSADRYDHNGDIILVDGAGQSAGLKDVTLEEVKEK
ncbi:hypothetical protein HDZ31DRAFT_62631 [Schizophyllum fasciatum]